MKPTPNDYRQAEKLLTAIESELKKLNRWSEPLPAEAFTNMGAFGQNTMAFEQWIQFILLDRLKSIVAEGGDFPDGSQLATYASRVFDGDSEMEALRDLLFQLDNLVNGIYISAIENKSIPKSAASQSQAISLGSEKLPEVVHTLLGVLHQFDGEDLESQLQTYDTFLAICSPSVRPELSVLMNDAATRTKNENSRKRIEEAAKSILEGGRAALPYNHEEAMKKFMEEHRKNYPDQ